jgi:hypothetical protein
MPNGAEFDGTKQFPTTGRQLQTTAVTIYSGFVS